jgi:molybdopterin synthase catalytic subunit/molybdopterin converting factor small subunit
MNSPKVTDTAARRLKSLDAYQLISMTNQSRGYRAEEDRNQTDQIAVRVLFFGAARDAVGQAEIVFSLSTPTNAGSAFAQVLDAFPDLRRFGRSLLFAVNEEYAQPDREVRTGDELAVFPSVSGGSGPDAVTGGHGDAERQYGEDGVSPASRAKTTLAGINTYDFFELTTEPIDVGAVARRIVLPEGGATVTLDGYAREWTRGKRTLHLLYEAYPSMALREMQRLGQEAHDRFEIAHIGIVHRTGKLEIGETSVVIAVSAPHRRAAFEACEWAIRELKRTVPIWKKEVFEDGSVWVEGEAAAGETEK